VQPQAGGRRASKVFLGWSFPLNHFCAFIDDVKNAFFIDGEDLAFGCDLIESSLIE
jgi:hypothetical protein